MTPALELALAKRVSKLAVALDEGFRIPGTRFRYGWDSLVGLVLPVVGDWAMGFVSLTMVVAAIRLKFPKRAILRMLGNITLDVVFGMVPILGDAFDMFWKANRRNLKIFNKHLDELHRQHVSSITEHGPPFH